MTDREKLIELLEDKHCPIPMAFGDTIERLADHLLANGVTVGKDTNVPNKWIPVSERLPKKITNKVITLSKNGYVGFGHYEDYKGRKEWYNLETGEPFTRWDGLRSDEDDSDSYEITHWMPLPEPPKEDA